MLKPIAYISLILFILLADAACGDNSTENNEYRLTINNNTDTSYDVYRSINTFSGGSFSQVGTVNARESLTIFRLVIDVEYTFRLVKGENVDAADYQRNVQSGGDDVTWNVGG